MQKKTWGREQRNSSGLSDVIVVHRYLHLYWLYSALNYRHLADFCTNSASVITLNFMIASFTDLKKTEERSILIISDRCFINPESNRLSHIFVEIRAWEGDSRFLKVLFISWSKLPVSFL